MMNDNKNDQLFVSFWKILNKWDTTISIQSWFVSFWFILDWTVWYRQNIVVTYSCLGYKVKRFELSLESRERKKFASFKEKKFFCVIFQKQFATLLFYLDDDASHLHTPIFTLSLRTQKLRTYDAKKLYA